MLITVAGLGVLNSVVLDTRERIHDPGVCKAIGMSPRQTMSLVLAPVGSIGVIGGLIGVPVGYAPHGLVMPVMGRAVGTSPPSSVLDVYEPVQPLLPGLGGVVIALLGALVPAGWAARARTATAPRTEWRPAEYEPSGPIRRALGAWPPDRRRRRDPVQAGPPERDPGSPDGGRRRGAVRLAVNGFSGSEESSRAKSRTPAARSGRRAQPRRSLRPAPSVQGKDRVGGRRPCGPQVTRLTLRRDQRHEVSRTPRGAGTTRPPSRTTLTKQQVNPSPWSPGMLHVVYCGKQVERVGHAEKPNKIAGQALFPAGSRITTHSTWCVIGKTSQGLEA
ncbi:ABC transporter permease [Streptomyces prasinus]|uniref:ABC transporter permease n=1 Tax=Streptomyces prasinus TaxID=67345 RepID=UPI0036B4FC13